MEVEAITEGLWRWTAPHPDWTADADWPRDVGCLYYEAPGAVVLIDPLVPEGEEKRFWQALDRDIERLGRPVAVLLTVHWHERSVDEVVARYGGSSWRSQQDAPLPQGVEAYPARAVEETVFWIPEHAALVPGDVLVADDGPLRLCPASWLPEGGTLDQVRNELAPLLGLPVERVLVSHGEPVLAAAREALARALQPASAA